MKHLEKIIAILMLTFAIGFNLWLYRAEPTGMVDPNDNAFQYALVERTNVIWDWAGKYCKEKNKTVIPVLRSLGEGGCHLSFLTDHWVPNWAEGYNLPYYYSHVPQIVIVGTYRLLSVFRLLPSTFSIFQYYHWLIYFLLCFFPISVFLSLRILKQPWLTAGIGALLASHISTDGLYGIDPASFLWRGWGLSSQLFAMIFMPLAIAFIIRVVNSKHFELMGGTRSGLLIEHPQSRKMPHQSFFITLKRYVCGQKTLNNKTEVMRDEDVGWGITRDRTHDYIFAILFITLTTMGHLGMGLMLFFTLPVIAFTRPFLSFLHQQSFKTIWGQSKEALLKVIVLALPPLVLLSYWIIPTFLDSAYHNVSFWDPVWKFNSYGAKEVLLNLTNGYLFDWGRLPIYTMLVFFGLFVSILEINKKGWVTRIWGSPSSARIRQLAERTSDGGKCVTGPALSFLFLFFLLLYFGKTTWGGILDFIPGMNEFHQHRFIVGVHLVGLFLAPIGLSFLVQLIWRGGTFFMKYILRWVTRVGGPPRRGPLVGILGGKHATGPVGEKDTYYAVSQIGITLLLLIFILPPIYKQTISYGTYNQTLIEKANATYLSQKADAELLLQTLRELMKDNPGRVFAGRGGGWGKNFSVAESAYFMYLSTYGIPTILWLPETWSLNSDTEQYFSENNPSHYELFNVRYVVAPLDTKPQPFWTSIKETDHWKLYGVSPSTNLPTSPSSYITSASSPSVVYSDKLSFANVVRLWIQSDYPEKNIFPELRLTGKNPASQGQALRSYTQLPHFWMLDEATYITPDAKTHSLFAEPPVYISPFGLKTEDRGQKTEIPITIINQSNDTDMVFRATIKVSSSSSSPSSVISLPSSVSCPTCVVVLKQTYHPNWRATVNGKPVQTLSVFPSYVAVRLEEPGNYEVVFSYTPSTGKMVLLGLSVVLVVFFFIIKKRYFAPPEAGPS